MPAPVPGADWCHIPMSKMFNRKIEKSLISLDTTLWDALSAIESNKRKFLVCVDENNKVIGSIVDGDIRRSLLRNPNVHQNIGSAVNRNTMCVRWSAGFADVCAIFKNEKIEFIPIVDEDGVVLNIITKRQFHILMLNDVEYRPSIDFTEYDDRVLEHEIYNRPWGFYKSTLLSSHAQAKIITVFPNSQLSLQEHKRREEHWVVMKGMGRCVLDESVIDIYPGKYIFIPKGCLHRAINNASDQNLILSEVQLGSYFGEDDIIRHEDDYGRI